MDRTGLIDRLILIKDRLENTSDRETIDEACRELKKPANYEDTKQPPLDILKLLHELIETLENRQEEYTQQANEESSQHFLANCAGHVGEATFVIERLKDILTKV